MVGNSIALAACAVLLVPVVADIHDYTQPWKTIMRRLGYRLVLKELKHPKQTHSGGELKLAMNWQNTGSAPCYRPYRLAYRLTDGGGHHRVFVGSVTVNEWMPGEIETYKLSIPVVGKEKTGPIIQLGIEGRNEDGWYPLSTIRVSGEKTALQTKMTAPDFSALKEGMTLAHAEQLLGSTGRLRANSSYEEAIYDFDFDGKSAVLVVDRRATPAIVSKVILWNHGKTVEQVRADRLIKWREWVEARSANEHP